MNLVEDEVKSIRTDRPDLVARRIEGRLVLYREGALPEAAGPQKGSMALLDRIRALFSSKSDNQKKVSFLSEKRAALTMQRERVYQDLSDMEQQENQLKRQFRESTAAITKKRVTSQILQIRKEADRRHQMLDVLNRQVEVVSTHLHSLQLLQQGQSAELPDGDELAEDAVAAEEMLARLEADAEIAESITPAGGSRLSVEEQRLYEELEQEARQPASTQTLGQPGEAPSHAGPMDQAADSPQSQPAPQRDSTKPDGAQRRPPEAAEPG